MWLLLGRRICAHPPLRPYLVLYPPGFTLPAAIPTCVVFKCTQAVPGVCGDWCPVGGDSRTATALTVEVLRPGVAGQREAHPEVTRQKHVREREREREDREDREDRDDRTER